MAATRRRFCHSGLQRSTVSLIAEELIQGEWVLEGQTGKLPRGRRPTFLQLNDQRAVIALDIHPSHTMVAVVDLGGRIVAQNLVVLPEDPAKAMKMLIAAIKNMMTANKDIWTFSAPDHRVDLEDSVYLAGSNGPRRTRIEISN